MQKADTDDIWWAFAVVRERPSFDMEYRTAYRWCDSAIGTYSEMRTVKVRHCIHFLIFECIEGKGVHIVTVNDYLEA